MAKRLIQYIGKKPRKTDNANSPSSEVIWNGPHDVQPVEEKFCPSLLKFPSIWRDVTDVKLVAQGAGLGSSLSGPGEPTKVENPAGSPPQQPTGDGNQGAGDGANQPPQGDGDANVVEFSDDKATAIKQAIELLDPKNPEHFTGSGVPQVKAIEQLLGYDISAADRDAAWAEVNKGAGDAK